jgi:flagellar motor switch protein FliM
MSDLERDHRLGKVEKDVYTQQVLEILGALQKLGEELSQQEQDFLSSNMTAEMKNFVTVDNTGASINTSSVSSQIEKAKK